MKGNKDIQVENGNRAQASQPSPGMNPPSYEEISYLPEEHNSRYAGLAIPVQKYYNYDKDEIQESTVARYESALADTVDKHADSMMLKLFFPAFMLLAEAATRDVGLYSKACRDENSPPVCDEIEKNAFLTANQWDDVVQVLPYAYGLIIGIMLYRMMIGTRTVENFVTESEMQQDLISKQSAKEYRQSPSRKFARLADLVSVAMVATGGVLLTNRETTLYGCMMVTLSALPDAMRASLESREMEKLWKANYPGKKFIPMDAYEHQTFVRRMALLPALAGLAIFAFMITSLRDQRDAQDNSGSADQIQRNDHISLSLTSSLLFNAMIQLLTVVPLSSHKFAIEEGIIRHPDTTLRNIEVNTTTLFGIKMEQSTARELLAFISKASLTGAAAWYAYQSEHESNEVFPKAFIGALAGAIVVSSQDEWIKIRAKVGAQINAALRDHFKDVNQYAPISERAGQAYNYVKETRVIQYFTKKPGANTPLLGNDGQIQEEDNPLRWGAFKRGAK